jgi:ABC-type multidrug transport system ATPase subunit
MIRLHHVQKRYGAAWALRDVTLEVPAGCVYGLIGPNGAGKTTVLRLMAGLARPTQGEIAIDARPIGYLPQRVELHGLATPRETLRLFCRLRNLPEEAADEAVEASALQPHADRQVRVLSGGLRQRLGLAIACLGAPAVLLLDEPSAGLDPRAAIEWRREMKRFADGGRTVVVCSHSLQEMQTICDRIAVLFEGRLVLEGSVADLTSGADGASLDDLFMEAIS